MPGAELPPNDGNAGHASAAQLEWCRGVWGVWGAPAPGDSTVYRGVHGGPWPALPASASSEQRSETRKRLVFMRLDRT